MNITEERIVALAPNSNAVTNAKKISKSGGFVKLYKSGDNTFIYGECSGSGKNNYITSVDFIDENNPVFRCSCPSRQFPCKHGIAILFEYLASKKFEECEIPADINEKRQKKADSNEAKVKREESGESKKPDKAAAVKKMKKQLEGMDLAEKFINEVISRGISSLGGSSKASYEDLSKQLGDYYLPEPQNIVKSIVINIKQMSNDTNTACNEILKSVIKLRSVIKKGRAFLSHKIEKGEIPVENDPLLEAIGFTWQLSQLKEIGLCRQNAELVELSFDIDYDDARKEYIDTGWWIDLQTGEISKKENFRPLKALKYVKQDDTCFDVVMTPELYLYPGDINRRIRWDSFDIRKITGSDIKKIIDFAAGDINALLKSVKNYIKNPLSPDMVTVIFKYESIVSDGDRLYAKCADVFVELDDIAKENLTVLPEADVMTAQIHVKNGVIYARPLSLITQNQIIRLRY